MASNPYVNKVVLGSDVLLDLTGDTATAADVAEGKTFHLASGALATGTASGGGGDYLPEVDPVVQRNTESNSANIYFSDDMYSGIGEYGGGSDDRVLNMTITHNGTDTGDAVASIGAYDINDEPSLSATVSARSSGNVVVDATGNFEVAVDTALISGDTSATVSAPTVTISGSGQNGSASMSASSVSMAGNSAFVGGNVARVQGSTVTVASMGSGGTTTVSSAGTTTVSGDALALNATGSNSTARLSGYTLELLATNYTIANPSAFLSALGLASASGVSF